jgi:LysR family glycine cleavage system transcriptional activator
LCYDNLDDNVRISWTFAQLRVVEAAIRNNSFERAAEEFNVTPSAISQQVSKFEKMLGVRLFDRHARGVDATPKAAELAQRVGVAVDIVERALEDFAEESASGPVRLRIYQTWATRWFIPRLSALHQEWPDVRVQFETGMQNVDFSKSDIDFSVQFMPDADAGVLATPLFPQILVPVCTAGMAARLNTLDDLRNQPLIASANRPDDWPVWLSAMGFKQVAPQPNLIFSNSTLAYQAALAGSGIVMAQAHLIESEIIAGTLVAPFPTGIDSGKVIALVEPKGVRLRPAARAFKKWILAEAPTAGSMPLFLDAIL